MKKERKDWGRIGVTVLFFLVCVLAGAFCGMLFSKTLDSALSAEASMGEFLMGLAGLLVGLYAAFFLHIAAHEAGHLVGGLLSGYRFSSYRLGSWMLIKEGEKLRLRRFSIKGTGGQCLMMPPQTYHEKMPQMLYNLGGSLMNLLLALIFFGVLVLFHPQGIFGTFCKVMAFLGLFTAAVNGIPLRLPSMSNDGRNALEIHKSAAAHRAFWIQLQSVYQTSKGMRLKDMPAEWFELPQKEDMKNGLCAYLAAFAVSRAMDEGDFQKALAIGEKANEEAGAMAEIQKQMMAADLLYCEAVGECRREKIEAMKTRQLQKALKSLKNLPSIHRVNFTCALLIDGDEKAAQKHQKAFEKAAEKYPYPCEIQSEQELMMHAQAVYHQRNN